MEKMQQELQRVTDQDLSLSSMMRYDYTTSSSSAIYSSSDIDFCNFDTILNGDEMRCNNYPLALGDPRSNYLRDNFFSSDVEDENDTESISSWIITPLPSPPHLQSSPPSPPPPPPPPPPPQSQSSQPLQGVSTINHISLSELIVQNPATPHSSYISSSSAEVANNPIEEVEQNQDRDKSKKVYKPRKKNPKRERKTRFVFVTKTNLEMLDDGYRWRKYGLKSVKHSKYARSYYRCTSSACSVTKKVERSFQDTRNLITTYEGRHTHPCPVTTRSNIDMMMLETASYGSGINGGCIEISPKTTNYGGRSMGVLKQTQSYGGGMGVMQQTPSFGVGSFGVIPQSTSYGGGIEIMTQTTSYGGGTGGGGNVIMPQSTSDGCVTGGGGNVIIPQTTSYGCVTRGGVNGIIPQTTCYCGGTGDGGNGIMQQTTSYGCVNESGGNGIMPNTFSYGCVTRGGVNGMLTQTTNHGGGIGSGVQQQTTFFCVDQSNGGSSYGGVRGDVIDREYGFPQNQYPQELTNYNQPSYVVLLQEMHSSPSHQHSFVRDGGLLQDVVPSQTLKDHYNL